MKLLRVFPVLLAVLLSALFPLASVEASPGFTVEGALLVTEVSPGDTLTHKITLSITAADPSQDIVARVAEAEQNLDGTYKSYAIPSGQNNFSACSYITLDRNTAHLEPGSRQELIATVRVPSDAGDGGRYAVINIQTRPVGQGGVGISSAVNVPVYLTIKNTRLQYSGEIEAVSTGEITNGKPVDILVTFHNQGNVHFKVKGEVTVSEAGGKKLGAVAIASGTSIIPSMDRQLQASFIPDHNLSPGIYQVTTKVTLEDGTQLDEASSTFEVKESYLPPLPLTPEPSRDSSSSPPHRNNWLVIGLIGGLIALSLIAATLIIFVKRRRN